MHKPINGDNSYNNQESYIEEQKDQVLSPSSIMKNNNQLGKNKQKESGIQLIDNELNKSSNSIFSASKQHATNGNSQIGGKQHSSSSSSFLTLPKEDTSQIAITEKYKQNIIRDEQCIHVKEPLLKVKHKQKCTYKISFWKRIKNMFYKPQPQQNEREIYLNGDVYPMNEQINSIKNTKYSVINFLPLVLWNIFSRFMNLFFLFIMISQFIYDLKVGQVYTYLSPVVVIVFLLIAREAYDDIQRYLLDKKFNSINYQILNHQYLFQDVEYKDLKVGQIIGLSENQIAPADLLILYSTDPNGNALISTDKFDGKTRQINRKAINYFQQDIKRRQNDYFQVIDTDGCVTVPPPSAQFKQFEANFKLNDGYTIKNEQLTVENTIWANCQLQSGFVVGLIIYTGKETKTNMNGNKSSYKIGKLDLEANYLMKFYFGAVLLYAALIIIIKGNILSSLRIMIDFVRYVILLSNIVPVCLRINLELAKIYFSFQINNDPDMEGVHIKDQNLPEELGRVQFLLADKTGTLTKNEMRFNKVALEQATFTHEEMIVMQSIIINQCQRHAEPLANYQLHYQTRRSKEEIFRDLVTAMTICHTVNPGTQNNTNEITYFGESQDEVAFVKFAEQLGIKLMMRTNDTIAVENCRENRDYFQILEVFHFTSYRRKMGMIVKHLASQKLIYYTKGSPHEMKDSVAESSRKFIEEESSNIASEGIRVMVFAQKCIEQSEYNEWKSQQQKPFTMATKRESGNGNQSIFDKFEHDMEFLGIVGVEDQLRDGIQQTLESLYLAGISVWIVTGDSMETAMSAAIQSGIKKADQHFHTVRNVSDDIDIKAKLMYINSDRNSKKQILVMDGQSLNVAMEVDEKQLVNVCTRAASVLLCKCSPKQKQQIVDLIKKYTSYRIAAVGDGSNDVGMLQSAHVGIGLYNEDSNNAVSLAADVIIPDIFYLNQLILWHGRLCYKKGASLCSFVFQRGLVIAFVELIFVGVFFTISMQIFNGQLLLCFASIFTIFPVLTLLMDSDIDIYTCMQFPQLYKSAIKGRHLNLRTFFSWIWKAVYMSTVLMMLIFTWFRRDYFLNIETFVFFELIISEYFQVFVKLFSLKTIKKQQILSIVISLLVYGLILVFLQEQFAIGSIWKFKNIGILVGIVLIAWVPIYSIQLLRMRIEPTDDEKIIKNAQQRKSSDSITE